MRNFFNSAGDRLLAVFVPNSTAGACVPEHGDVYYRGCGCSSDKRYYQKRCTITCYGGLSCGACYRTGNIC